VVEDHPIVRACMAQGLVEAGFEALAVASASEAIALLEARPDIRLVFTEVEIPATIDGLNLARRIRDRWPPVKLIVVSGGTLFSQADLPLGAKFVPKPYHNAAIVQQMNLMLLQA
jgi:CheY-like chemotaxis protein